MLMQKLTVHVQLFLSAFFYSSLVLTALLPVLCSKLVQSRDSQG